MTTAQRSTNIQFPMNLMSHNNNNVASTTIFQKQSSNIKGAVSDAKENQFIVQKTQRPQINRTALGEINLKERQAPSSEVENMMSSLLTISARPIAAKTLPGQFGAIDTMIAKPTKRSRSRSPELSLEDDDETSMSSEDDDQSQRDSEDSDSQSDYELEDPLDDEIPTTSALQNAMLDPMEVERLDDGAQQEVWDDSILDVDEENKDDPAYCTEYIHQIFQYWKKKEMEIKINPGYMSNQQEITTKHRSVLVTWLSEVTSKFNLLPETYYLTVHILDKMLSQISIVKSKLQLLGITAMLVASKHEELCHPKIEDFLAISADLYIQEQMLKMEILILSHLNYNLNAPSSLMFLRRFSSVACSDTLTHTFCKYMLELTCLEYHMLKYLPSVIAAASVYLARRLILGNPRWDSTLVHYTGYKDCDIIQCAREINTLLKAQHKAFQIEKESPIFRKYASSKSSRVALIKPAAEF